MTMTENTKAILMAIANGDSSAKDVAAHLNVKVPVVTGSLATLKKGGFVEVVEGALKATDAGRAEIGMTVVSTKVAGKKGARKAQAVAIIASMPAAASRKDVMARLMSEMSMSAAQASTYHYAICGSKGIWNS